MSFLFIGSTGDRAGHSLLTWAIAQRLLEKGLKVGFIKPFGTHPIFTNGTWADHDAVLFKEVLKLQEPLDRICPYLVSEDSWRQKGAEEILRAIKSLTGELSEGKDILIIMGSKHIFFDDTSWPFPDVPLITELNADFVLVSRYRETSKSLYSFLSITSMLKDRIKGIILNRVPPEKLEEIRNDMIPSLSEKGIPITDVVPEDPLLSFTSLREMGSVLEGEFLCGKESLDQSVGRMTVGSTDLTDDLRLFKRVNNKIILLEPFPPDEGIHEPSARRKIAGIILTGGRKPAEPILQVAKKAQIPLLLTKEDTFSALERLEQSPPRLSPHDEGKVRHFTDLMDRNAALDSLLESIRVAPG
ncbi:MAG: phosphotransacetylase family protein [Deltaproteobacteria bacterium]|nr:phosphotransacetylase family protein [Deltaproteobacteria bacterium]